MGYLWTRARRIALVALALAALPVTLIGVANAWVLQASERHAQDLEGLRGGEAVAIVPGATASPLGHPTMTLTRRLEAAVSLYRANEVSAILISGIDTPQDPEVRTMRAWLSARGIPERDVLVDPAGSRTRATMLNAARFFHVTRAIICTENISLPRALFLARQAGIDAEGVSLPTPRAGMLRWLGVEALKNTLAFVESFPPSQRLGQSGTAIALH